MHLNPRCFLCARWLVVAFAFGCLTSVVTAQPTPAQPRASAAQGNVAGSTQRNIYAAGGQVRPAGPVRGDFTAAGGRIILDQSVGGDAALAGGAVDVRASVGDDLRAAGGDVSIESAVGGELFAAGGNITMTRAAVIAGGARVYGGNITMEGRVDGPLTANTQKVLINGEVRGDVHAAGADIELGPQARVGGALTYASPSELKRAEGATVAGSITRQDEAATRGPRRERGAERSRAAAWVGGAFSFLGFLACAAVLLGVAPLFAVRTSQRITATPWRALAAGLGTLLAVPVLAVLLFLTLLGIPLGIVVLALYPVLLLVGFVVGALFIARLLPAVLRRPTPATYARNLGYVALALVLIFLVGRVPFVGGVLVGLVTLAGVGACLLELYGRRQGPGAAAVLGGRPEPSPSVAVPDAARGA